MPIQVITRVSADSEEGKKALQNLLKPDYVQTDTQRYEEYLQNGVPLVANIGTAEYGGDKSTNLLNEVSFDLEITFPLVNGRYHEITLDLAKDLRFTNPNIKYINWNDSNSKLEPYLLSGINKHTFKNNSTTTPTKVYRMHIYLTTKSFIYESFESIGRVDINSNTYSVGIKVSNVLYRYTQV